MLWLGGLAGPMGVVSTAVACSIVAQAMAPEVPVVPQQALDSHYLQRALSHELPLPLATWHGTHNSFNVNNRTGVFFEVPHNQIYDIDAQLRYLGVRYIEIDVHYIPEITEGTDADRCVTHMACSGCPCSVVLRLTVAASTTGPKSATKTTTRRWRL